MTCAVLWAERGYRAHILAEEISPRITSAAAGAIWFPYDAEPVDKVIAWSLETFAVLRDLSGTTAAIVAECSRVLEIEPPKVLGERVGLRPFRRGGICLRADRLRDGCS